MQVLTFDPDQIYPSIDARFRFSAFARRSTPELMGKVDRIASDQFVRPEVAAQPCCAVRINLKHCELKHLKGLTVVAGMPAEVMMTPRPRTVLSYLDNQ